MKKIISLILVIVFMTGCIPASAATKSSKALSVDEQVDKIISSMSTEEKLAQMMIVALRDDVKNSHNATKLTKPYKNILKKYIIINQKTGGLVG